MYLNLSNGSGNDFSDDGLNKVVKLLSKDMSKSLWLPEAIGLSQWLLKVIGLSQWLLEVNGFAELIKERVLFLWELVIKETRHNEGSSSNAYHIFKSLSSTRHCLFEDEKP